MKRLTMIIAAFFVSSAGATYKCVDERGVTLIGDTPPDGCANVVMYEVSRSGQVIRKIDPTPTAEAQKASQENAAQRKQEERKAAEQKRLDNALLNTYASEKEFDVARDRNIEPINGRIKVSKDRIVAVDKRMKEIQDEMEFYKAGKSKDKNKAGKEMPQNLVQDLDRAKKEKENLEKGIEKSEAEIEALRAKYEADKQRWVVLRNAPDKK